MLFPTGYPPIPPRDPVSLLSVTEVATRATQWKCAFPHLVAGGALWRTQRHLEQTRMGPLHITRTPKMFIFARFYKGFTDAACISRIAVLPTVLHGFGNARYKWWMSREKYNALSDMQPCNSTCTPQMRAPCFSYLACLPMVQRPRQRGTCSCRVGACPVSCRT